MTEEQEHNALRKLIQARMEKSSGMPDVQSQRAYITGYATDMLASIWEQFPEAREYMRYHLGDLS